MQNNSQKNSQAHASQAHASQAHGGIKPSPFAPPLTTKALQVPGIEARTAACGLRYSDRDDLLLLSFAKGSVCAALFTQSTAPAAPVIWSKQAIAKNPNARAMLINAGQANALSGSEGTRAMEISRDALAKISGISKNEVLLASTGVIGEPLNGEKIAHILPQMLAKKPCDWLTAARAITTTDSFPKVATANTDINGTSIQITGIAKGSGMIAPNMATMIACIATDAKIEPKLLQQLLSESNEQAFNAISVDSDTSTNDTLLAVASGKQKHTPITSIDFHNNHLQKSHAQNFINSFYKVMQSLAKQIAMDGEGISKFITVRTKNAQNKEQARTIGLSILSSPLVKIALAYNDPNWGRIAMAIGKTKLHINWQKVTIAFGESGEHVVFANGEPTKMNTREETQLKKTVAKPRITILIDLQEGKAHPVDTWGCDLTHENLRINGDYRS